MIPESLLKHARLITDNFSSIYENYPPLAQFAELIHGMFCELLGRQFKCDLLNHAQAALQQMLFGAYQSWVQAFILIAAGHSDAGLSSIRRAIEYTCYSAKIAQKPKRAMDWLRQRKDPEARERFSRECSIPLAYRNDEYRLLRPLIVAYEVSNYWGAHGNFEVLAHKLPHYKFGTSLNEGRFSFLVPPDVAFDLSCYIAVLGYRILNTFQTLIPIQDPGAWCEQFSQLTSMLHRFRIWAAEIEYSGQVPQSIIEFILSQELPSLDDRFEEIIREAQLRQGQSRGQSNCN